MDYRVKTKLEVESIVYITAKIEQDIKVKIGVWHQKEIRGRSKLNGNLKINAHNTVLINVKN